MCRQHAGFVNDIFKPKISSKTINANFSIIKNCNFKFLSFFLYLVSFYITKKKKLSCAATNEPENLAKQK